MRLPYRRCPSIRWLAHLTSLALAATQMLAGWPNAAEAATRKIYYYHPDHLGSTNLVTDEQGQVVQQVEYRPFGAVAARSGSVSLPQQFTGQRADATGLYYYNARYYDPDLGRFVQPDPIVQATSDPQTLNRYSYVRNNPLRYTDPSGYSFWSKFFGAIAAVVIGAVTAGLGTILSAGLAAGVFGALDGGISAYQAGGGWSGALRAGGIGFAAGFAGSAAGQFTSSFVSAFTSQFAGNAFGSLASGATSGAVGAGLSGGPVGRSVLAGAAAGLSAFTLAPLGPNAMFLASNVVGAAVMGENPLSALREGAGSALGYTLSTTAAVYAFANRVPSDGQIDAQPGDRLYYPAREAIGAFVILLEGGPFSHVNVFLGDGKVADNSLGTNTQERRLSAFAGRPFVRANRPGTPGRNLANLTADLANSHPQYSPNPVSLWVCSTCTSTLYGQAGLSPLTGVGPNAQYLLNTN